MPKPRTTDRKQLAFQVSPWNSVKGNNAPASDEGIDVRFIRPARAGANAPPVAAEPAADVTGTPTPAGEAQPWRTTKKRRVEPVDSIASAQEAENSAAPLDNHPDMPAADEQQQLVVEGPAMIAVLPSGALTGHLVDSHRRVAYGVSGRVLYGTPDCTQEEDWMLLEVTIKDFETSQVDHAVVERTGGDMMRLRPPDGLPAAAHRAVEAQVPHPDQLGELQFACEQLHTEEAAQKLLSKYQPDLAHRGGVIVNQGWMTWQPVQVL